VLPEVDVRIDEARQEGVAGGAVDHLGARGCRCAGRYRGDLAVNYDHVSSGNHALAIEDAHGANHERL
jgi:hypothetical protein